MRLSHAAHARSGPSCRLKSGTCCSSSGMPCPRSAPRPRPNSGTSPRRDNEGQKRSDMSSHQMPYWSQAKSQRHARRWSPPGTYSPTCAQRSLPRRTLPRGLPRASTRLHQRHRPSRLGATPASSEAVRGRHQLLAPTRRPAATRHRHPRHGHDPVAGRRHGHRRPGQLLGRTSATRRTRSQPGHQDARSSRLNPALPGSMTRSSNR
jgi:hypothetical protein